MPGEHKALLGGIQDGILTWGVACDISAMSGAGQGKALVERLVGEVVNQGRLELIDELFTPEISDAAREWFGSFRSSFPDVRMEIVELVEEGDTVVGRFLCSATHSGDRRISAGWGIEDSLARYKQLGLPPD